MSTAAAHELNEGTDNLAHEVGRAIAEERRLAGLLPSETASQAQVRPPDLNSIERGERLPTGEELEHLLRAFKITPKDFKERLSGEATAAVERLLGAGEEAPSERGAHLSKSQASSAPAPQQTKATAPRKKRRADEHPRRERGISDRFRGEGQQGKSDGSAPHETPVTLPNVRANIPDFFSRIYTRTPGEIVYRWEYEQTGLLVKVYSSINSETMKAYPTGLDALRVIVFDRRSERKVEAYSCRINRTGDWPKRLRRMTGEAVVRATRRPRCPRCQQHPEMLVRGLRGSQFWSCPNYEGPKRGCRFTFSIGAEVTDEEEGLQVGDLERVRKGPRPNRNSSAIGAGAQAQAATGAAQAGRLEESRAG